MSGASGLSEGERLRWKLASALDDVLPEAGFEGLFEQVFTVCAELIEAREAAWRGERDELLSALDRTEANFRSAVAGRPVRDMAENLAENASARARSDDEPSEVPGLHRDATTRTEAREQDPHTDWPTRGIKR